MTFWDRRRAIAQRKNHPLVKLLRQIRRRHKKTQVDVEACMQEIDAALISMRMLERIEGGRRDLPGMLGGTGPPLSQWIQAWLRCVHASGAERDEVEAVLVAVLLGRLSYGLGAEDEVDQEEDLDEDLDEDADEDADDGC